jgi:WD40 repeat protein/beta-lactamase regulating signal transducer with metallopeptidase domain
MSLLVSIALANAACATLIALLALVVGRFCRRPAVLHSLWLLVLLKLVTPPFWPITVANLPEEPATPVAAAPPAMLMEYASFAPSSSEPGGLMGWMNAGEGQSRQARLQKKLTVGGAQRRPDLTAWITGVPAGDSELAPAQSPAATLPPVVNSPPSAERSPGLESCLPLLGVVWLAGVGMWLLWAMLHVGRFQHLLRHARPAGADIQEQADRLARQMGLRYGPEVWLLPGPLPPLVWAAVGRVRVFFPAKLLQRLDETERASLLAHELAHVRRRDHWVRWLELVASALYWWYPLVWLARRRMHIQEEECCDAWVVGEVPARAYAAAILNTLDFLAEDQAPLPVMASGLSGVEMLKRRLSLIMGGGTPKRLSSPAKCILVLAGLLLLSLRPNLAQTETKTAPAAEQPKAKAEPAATTTLEEPTVFNSQPKNLLGGNNDFWSVAISPDGKRLATGSGYWDRPGEVRVWDFATRKPLWSFAETLGVASVAISPDGKRLASANWAREGRLRDLASGKEIARLALDSVARVAFSPDGRVLASVSGDKSGELKLWDAATGKALVAVKEAKGLRCVAFSPDGKTLATGSFDNNVQLREAPTGKILRLLKGHQGGVNSLSFAPDGRSLLTGSLDKTAKLWELATGKDLMTLRGHQDWVLSVAFAPDGKSLATASKDLTTRVWDTASGKVRMSLNGHTQAVETLAFAPDGKTLATGSWDQTVLLWDMSSGQIKRRLQGQRCGFQCLDFSPDGKTLATSSGHYQNAVPGELRLWDVATGQTVRVLQGHTKGIRGVRFSPDGNNLASVSDAGIVKLWSIGAMPRPRAPQATKAP